MHLTKILIGALWVERLIWLDREYIVDVTDAIHLEYFSVFYVPMKYETFHGGVRITMGSQPFALKGILSSPPRWNPKQEGRTRVVSVLNSLIPK